MSDEAKPEAADKGDLDAKLLAFKKAGNAIAALTAEDRAAVLRALCILHEVKP